MPSQVCITRDNTQLQVDGILYFQVTDPMRASYGSSNYIFAITQLAQTTLRSVIGKLELDKTFEERDNINAQVVAALDEAAPNWGVKVLRYEIKDLTPPKEILHAMQAQITAEREKRALIAASEGPQAGADQHRHRRARGVHRALRRRAAGGDQQGAGRGGGDHRGGRGHRRRRSARSPRRSVEPGGEQAVKLKVAEQYVERVRQLAKTEQHDDRAGQSGGHEFDDRVGADDREGRRRRRHPQRAEQKKPGYRQAQTGRRLIQPTPRSSWRGALITRRGAHDAAPFRVPSRVSSRFRACRAVSCPWRGRFRTLTRPPL